MRVGVSGFVTDQSLGPIRLAQEVERRGFTELWIPEHSHIPVGRETDWPLGPGDLPEQYKRSYDQFVALSAAAVATTDIVLGTGVCLIPQHDPISLAKTVASVDHLSNGRLVFGVGFGWNVDEMRHHGVDPNRRRSIGRDKALAMRELWTNDVADYHGTFVDFGPSWQWPKPVQRPHPPIWVGGGKATIRHAVEWGDGWMPIEGAMPVVELVARLREQSERAGRDPATITVYVVGVAQSPATIQHYYEAGIEGVSFWVPWDAGEDQARRVLDDHMEFRDRYIPGW